MACLIDITAENQQHLADTMRHSDVVVNVASTLAVEAAIVDTPVVNISFDGEQPSEWLRSARRYYRFTHYVNVTRHNAARVAETPEHLVEYVGRYLEDPSLDREGRRAVAAEQCQFFDGRSASRVAGFVAAELADVRGFSTPSPHVWNRGLRLAEGSPTGSAADRGDGRDTAAPRPGRSRLVPRRPRRRSAPPD